jgi:hypothetical protein
VIFAIALPSCWILWSLAAGRICEAAGPVSARGRQRWC